MAIICLHEDGRPEAGLTNFVQPLTTRCGHSPLREAVIKSSVLLAPA